MTTPTWAVRELPVLIATVELYDELFAAGRFPDGEDIASRCGIDITTLATALKALDGEYLDLRVVMGPASRWHVLNVTPAARRATGQWPTPENIVERLAAAMTEAAEHESDPARKSRLQTAAQALGGFANAVAVNVLSQVIGQHI